MTHITASIHREVAADLDIAQRQLADIFHRGVAPTAAIGLVEGQYSPEIIGGEQNGVLVSAGIGHEMRIALDHHRARLCHATCRACACGGAQQVSFDRGLTQSDFFGSHGQIAARADAGPTQRSGGLGDGNVRGSATGAE